MRVDLRHGVFVMQGGPQQGVCVAVGGCLRLGIWEDGTTSSVSYDRGRIAG